MGYNYLTDDSPPPLRYAVALSSSDAAERDGLSELTLTYSREVQESEPVMPGTASPEVLAFD